MDDESISDKAWAAEGFELWGPRVMDGAGRIGRQALPSRVHLAQALMDAWDSGSPAVAIACGKSRVDLDARALSRLEAAWRRSRWDQGAGRESMPRLAWAIAQEAWPRVVVFSERERLEDAGAGSEKRARPRL